MKIPERREDFDDFYILCEDVSSYGFAFKDCSFNEVIEIMLKLNKNRNIEFRMELCFDNSCMPEDKSMLLFCIGVLVLDREISGYVDIRYSETVQEQYPIDLTQVGKKMYGRYEFFSDVDLAIKGIEIIKEHFDISRLVPENTAG